VILTSGRFAGKKAIVAKTYDEGSKKYKFPHLLVAGIAKNLRTVKRKINKKKFAKKTGVKAFVKYINQNHVIPTRFIVTDFDFKDLKEDTIKTLEDKKTARKDVRKKFTETYRNLPAPKPAEKAHTDVRYFFRRIRF
jgi:large subunit ribosomal protein L27e